MHFVLDQGSWHDTKALAVAFSGFRYTHGIVFLLQIHMPSAWACGQQLPSM